MKKVTQLLFANSDVGITTWWIKLSRNYGNSFFLIKNLRHETKNYNYLAVFGVAVLLFVQKEFKARDIDMCLFCREETKLLGIRDKVMKSIDVQTFCVVNQL